MKNLSLSTTKIFLILSLLSITFLTQQASAQSSYKAATGSQIKVLGTSNLHDWDMNATYFNCDANLVITDGVLKNVNALSFALQVKNLKAKEDLMNTRAYKALKESEFDKITFKLTEATVSASQKVVKVFGNLTIG